jgi:hypothetical protein
VESVNTISQRILILLVAFAFLSPALRCELPQKASHPAQEDRIKKLEDRLDAAEKAASAAAMEKDYIGRTQKLYESYYQRTFDVQMWTMAIVGLLLVVVFSLVARFSLNMFEQRTKLATTDATAQIRNEYIRILSKEVQKLWDTNAADNKKLKEALTAQIALLEQNLKDQSDFAIQFVHGLAAGSDERHDDSLLTFRQALAAYKSAKPRNLIETKVGATTLRHIFESLRKQYGENFIDKAREELTDPLYTGLDEELALTALQSPWLTPLINERTPAAAAPPPPEPAVEARVPVSTRAVLPAETDLALDEESSCRLISS